MVQVPPDLELYKATGSLKQYMHNDSQEGHRKKDGRGSELNS